MTAEEKVFPQNANFLLACLRESAAVQNWIEQIRRGDAGAIVYVGVMYGVRHEYRFTFTETSAGTSILIETDEPGAREEILRQFLLLEKIIAEDKG